MIAPRHSFAPIGGWHAETPSACTASLHIVFSAAEEAVPIGDWAVHEPVRAAVRTTARAARRTRARAA